jgi:hypothetical protein
VLELSAVALLLEAIPPHQRREAIARRDAGETLTDIARSYNTTSATAR